MVTYIPLIAAPVRSTDLTVREPDAALVEVLDEVELLVEVVVEVEVVVVAVVVEVVVVVELEVVAPSSALSVASVWAKREVSEAYGLLPPRLSM
jgi:hypothetical protein